jgi:single-strand DNA-binding protein
MHLNKVLLIGHVGKDPDVRYFDNGAAMANFPLATSERGYTLANGVVVPERTEWHNVVTRREQATFVEKWVRKGSSVLVEGKIRSRNYIDQTGAQRYITEIYADKIEFFHTAARTAEANPVQPKPAQSTPQPPQPLTGELASNSDANDLPF